MRRHYLSERYKIAPQYLTFGYGRSAPVYENELKKMPETVVRRAGTKLPTKPQSSSIPMVTLVCSLCV